MADRLYGLSDAEDLYNSIAGLWENELEPYFLCPGLVDVHEWTVRDPLDHLPGSDQIIDWLAEWSGECGEVDERWSDDFPFEDEEVRAAADRMLRVIADRIKYRMAGRRVATHRLAWYCDGTVTVNGALLEDPRTS